VFEHMSPEPAFLKDTYIVLTRTCIVFPADGSKPRVADMIIRTVTTEDTNNAKIFNRTVDLLASYRSEYRKMRSWPFTHFGHSHMLTKHLVYFNMSPKLPLNRCVARIIGLNPDNLGSELFWRGDVVVMEYKSQDGIFIDCQNANASEIIKLEEYLKDAYYEGRLERELAQDVWVYGRLRQLHWHLPWLNLLLLENFCSNWSTTAFAMITGHHWYWGSKDWRRLGGIWSPSVKDKSSVLTRRDNKMNF